MPTRRELVQQFPGLRIQRNVFGKPGHDTNIEPGGAGSTGERFAIESGLPIDVKIGRFEMNRLTRLIVLRRYSVGHQFNTAPVSLDAI